MSEIIHSTYEVVKKIGAGGGGVVYLANHLNLGKQVVLKADKRKITTRPELLRREVDVMKNLNHPYIPHVYDFFIEDNTVYTAIDFIEGESLDRPLRRGEKFTQPQVIRWGQQLLEALEYLHEPRHGNPPKGYVHSDIKPANLMRTPENNICLIDFNIALALGEENIVGHSIGYASPEHYGIDYSSDNSEVETQSGTISTKKHITENNPVVTEVELPNLENEHTIIESTDEEIKNNNILSAENSNSGSNTNTAGETAFDDSFIDESNLSEKTGIESEVYDFPKIQKKVVSDTDKNKETLLTEYEKSSATPFRQITSPVSLQTSNENEKSLPTQKKVMPDVRSDIYMVGATLYHLLCGKRPEKDAKEVIPLSKDEFSPQLVDIISKAMMPNPDLRFQTATEMLYAFNHLHENDERMKKHKRQKKILLLIFTFLFTAGIVTTFIGLKRIQTAQSWENYISYSNDALENGNTKEAINYALKAIPNGNGLLIPHKNPNAQLALTEALGVYNLADDYQINKIIELPSAPLYTAISPNGKTAICIYAFEMAVIDTENGSIIDTLPVVDSALAEAEYLDNDNIIFAGVKGISKYNIQSRTILWCGESATAISVSADKRKAAAIYKDNSSAIVYDTQDGSKLYTVDFKGKKQSVTVNDIFANPNDNIFCLNEDGTMLGISFSDDSAALFMLSSDSSAVETVILKPNEKYQHFEGGFYQNYFAFLVSSKTEKEYGIAVVDTNTMTQTDVFQFSSSSGVLANENGILLQNDKILVKLNPITSEQTSLVSNNHESIYQFSSDFVHTLISTETSFAFYTQDAIKICEYDSKIRPDFLEIANGTALIGSMDSSTIKIFQYREKPETDVFTYDSSCEHLEARISADFETVILFSYKQFSIFDANGKLVTSVDIPNAEQVNDQQFIRELEKSYLEVIYNDGRRIDYDASNGNVISEIQGEPPDMTLYEEFETGSYRITCPLHGTPEIYNIRTGDLLCKLNEDAYLTYATQVNGQLVLQYLAADGNRYGQILNEKFELTAQLPYLCDVINEMLVFDYPSGNVRTSPIYDLNQLIQLAESQKGV